MRIESTFIHRADMVKPGSMSGRDAYGRPTYSEVSVESIDCRIDQITLKASRDEEGTDIVATNVLICGPDVKLTNDCHFENIRDQQGNPILPGVYGIENIFPASGRFRLHHYEVTLKRE